MTWLYAKLGSAHRDQLRDKLRALPPTDQDLLLDRLADRGILKEPFRSALTNTGQIESEMLSGRASKAKLNSFNELSGINLVDGSLFAGGLPIISTLTTGMVRGCEYLYHQKTFQWALAGGKAALTAIAIASTLSCFSFFVDKVPDFTSRGWFLGIGTATGALATMFNDRLNPNGLLAGTARFFSRKLFPFFIIGSGVHLVNSLHENNMNISNLITQTGGLEGTFAFSRGLFLVSYKYINNHVAKLKDALTGEDLAGHPGGGHS